MRQRMTVPEVKESATAQRSLDHLRTSRGQVMYMPNWERTWYMYILSLGRSVPLCAPEGNSKGISK